MIITNFIHTLTSFNLCWLSRPKIRALSWFVSQVGIETIIIIIFIFMLTLIKGLLDPWSGFYTRTTLKSDFKTIIIIIFIFIFIRINNQPNSWFGACPESTFMSSFKIMIIIVVVIVLPCNNFLDWFLYYFIL
jgi:hypothetical protein